MRALEIYIIYFQYPQCVIINSVYSIRYRSN